MRKRSILSSLVLLFCLLGLAQGQDFVPGQIMIDIRHEYLPVVVTVDSAGNVLTGLPSLDTLNVYSSCLSARKVSNYDWEPIRGMYVLVFPDTVDLLELASSYLDDPHVHLADPCYIRSSFGHIPTDSIYPQQWGHNAAHMNTAGAWRYTSGIPEIVIEVIDWGTDWGHPDLAGNTWQNLEEDADNDGHTMQWNPVAKKWVFDSGDSNYYDDDGNGLVDDFVGWDFYDLSPTNPGDNDPRVEYISGDHGDHTAGTIAAVTNNTLTADEASDVCEDMRGTVAGTSWFSKIMMARFAGTDLQAVQAIEYGVVKEAHIISMSWGGTQPNSQLEQALIGAYNEGLLLVAAAGNHVYDVPIYPAAYDSVIAVAATDINDVKEYYSNYGTWVDLCAPGSNWSPGREHKWWRYCYSEAGGTSIATPFVAGVAALVWSCDQLATNGEVRSALENTADDICGIPGNYPYCYPVNKLGHGRVNALNAVRAFRPTPPSSGDCNRDSIVNVGDVVYLTSYLFKNGPPPDPVCVGDVNDDNVVDISDQVYLINYIYRGGPAPLDGCD